MLVGLVERKSEGGPLCSLVVVVEVIAVDEGDVLVCPVYPGVDL